jgi:hypothetical protein
VSVTAFVLKMINLENFDGLDEGEDLEEEEAEEETEDDVEHKNKLKEVVDTLRSKRAMNTQRPSTIVHVNTGALEVSTSFSPFFYFFSLISSRST